ncbi:General substrate transporter [Hyphomicrobium denitrificans ATCC 51888]|uniref:General substrate transporter n=1 Tax=Hyphomicrobium denitrificans (strain ATCC 51888 / DSM 1869 / NCIMB 11706 / TK 0415) TaxID=582899 RepID=D8JXI4_HYPDA|nr:MFS family transporter [Hyphomicrobium denitrificans]ADJ25165.1 General substrate transporter [Hyphomicrobium denitrificans ATCC 51888]
MNEQPTAPPVLGMRERIRAILIGSSGNLVEWYDFYVYAAFSLYFAKAFFPAGDQTAQLLNTAAIFAVGFLMRPIGAWLFGRMADRHGRRVALTTSVLLMCFGSALLAVTPVYATIGIAAPIILLVARMIQGLSLGGEYGTSATYLSEMATAERRGFYSSFQYVTLIGGQLAAMLVLVVLQKFVLTPAELDAWGWRIPFAIGAALAVVAYVMRRDLAETEAFHRSKRREGSLKALFAHPREVAIVVGLTLGGTLAFYTYTTYMQKFLVNTSGFSKDTATLISASALFVYMLMQPVVGAISDKIGRRPVLITFGVLGVLFTVPLLTAIQSTQDPLTAFFLILAGLAIVSCYTAINAVVKAELFPTSVRALGVGLPYALTVALFGGTAEYIALWLKQAGRETDFFWYVTICIGLSLVVYATMRDTRNDSAINKSEGP